VRINIPCNRDWYVTPYDITHEKDILLDRFESIELPHTAVMLPFNYFNESILWNIFTYVRHIKVTQDMQNKHVVLRFEGIGHKTKVYVNQTFVLEHKGGYLPFDVDLTEFVEHSNDLLIRLTVDTHEDPSIPPFGGVVDYLCYGGIYREAELIITDHAYIEDVFIEQYGKPSFKVHVYTSIEGGEIQLAIHDADGIEVISQNEIVSDESTVIPLTIPDLKLWDIESPHLYQAIVTYKHNDEMDQVSVRFGIREAVFKRDGFYLNQRKLKLIGLNRHQSYPYVGYAMPKSAQIEDADLIKFDLGCHIVRTSHYPQSTHFLNRCDEIGLLVFEEIPGWQHIGDEAWKKASLDNLDAMIERDRNHPSIILWGVRINESADDDIFYQRTNARAMGLDPTRQRGGVRNFPKSHFFENVYTYNDFSHFGNNRGLEKKEHIAGNVPYLITEFNGHMFPTKRYDNEAHRLNHLKRHLRVLNDALDPNNHISGAIGWSFVDYNTHQEFGSGDNVCYHGVMDMYRIPKIAAFAYRAEQDILPMLEVTSTMNLGDHPAGNLGSIYVMTNLDEIKVYKNDEYIQTFKPNRKNYQHLKHPPIIVDDLIGDLLMVNEKMKPNDARITKSVLQAVAKYGNHLPLSYKLKMLYILKKYKKTYDDAVKLFYTYMTGWGTKQNTYRFEGYKDHQLVKVVIKEPLQETDLILEHNGLDLHIEETYDVKRYVIKKVDQHQELLVYANDAIQIDVDGEIELIGPKNLSLSGGAIAFWIKGTRVGQGHITITCGKHTIIEEVNCV